MSADMASDYDEGLAMDVAQSDASRWRAAKMPECVRLWQR